MSLGDRALHAWCAAETAARGLGRRDGQGTVEYLGLALAIGVLLVAVSKAFSGKDHGVGDALAKPFEWVYDALFAPIPVEAGGGE